MDIGLRVDVDTYTGTRQGLPRLLDLLERHEIRASFFFSLGPDNMGRHLRRLVRPSFLAKMLRTGAPSLYGWDILLRGTLWPGPAIAPVLEPHLLRAARDGHEIGLHAWDHHRWQIRAARLTVQEISHELTRGINGIRNLIGDPPVSFAAPGWRGSENLLLAEEALAFRYASDCRGRDVFMPVAENRCLQVPQIPVTLPTYDEVIGRNGISERNYNEHLFRCMETTRLNTLTVHAEVEGMRCHGLFESFVREAGKRGMRPVPLGSLLPENPTSISSGRIRQGSVPGRDGWVCVQLP